MDFKASKEDEEFRLEVRKFIQDNWDPKGFFFRFQPARNPFGISKNGIPFGPPK